MKGFLEAEIDCSWPLGGGLVYQIQIIPRDEVRVTWRYSTLLNQHTKEPGDRRFQIWSFQQCSTVLGHKISRCMLHQGGTVKTKEPRY